MAPPSRSSVHGWGGWRALQFVDEAEEVAFIAKDFVGVRDSHYIVCGVSLVSVSLLVLLIDWRVPGQWAKGMTLSSAAPPVLRS